MNKKEKKDLSNFEIKFVTHRIDLKWQIGYLWNPHFMGFQNMQSNLYSRRTFLNYNQKSAKKDQKLAAIGKIGVG